MSPISYGAAMDESAAAAIDAPFVADGIAVLPEWIDFNGHMNVAYYVRAFDIALDKVYARVGFDPARMKAANASTFTGEMHITYQRELKLGDSVRVTTQVLGFDAKRVHLVQCMYHARDGYLAATDEWLLLYIDMTRRRVGEMPDDLRRHLTRVRDAHAALSVPPEVGRAIALRRPA